ncbi:MAG: hypothetical protein WCK41_00815 [Actinomycetes bacterium]
MEKIVYLLWNSSGRADKQLVRTMLGSVAQALLAENPAGLTMDLADDDASSVQVPLPPPPDEPSPFALVSLWINCHDDRTRFEALLKPHAEAIAGYLVTESIPTDYGDNQWASRRDWPDGERSPGVVMLTLMEKPTRLSSDEWYQHWYGTQTPMSTDIQPRIRYVRNAVARPLTPGAPPYRGIVEEAWPSIETVNDPMRFYLADGDDDLLAERMNIMLTSVGAFLDFDRIRLAAMSEYLIKTN